MAGEELTLLGLWASPFVIRVRIAFNLKGLTAYVYSEESIYHKSELLLKSNPVLKKVPVLLHDGKTICESQIILQYVDEAFPTAAGAPVLPSDPYDRAIARFWASYVDDKLFSAWLPVFIGKTAEERVEAATQVLATLDTLEQAFEECSKGKAFFAGDTVGLVDVVLGSFLGWLYATEAICGVKVVDATRTPLLAAWAERFCALDAAKGLIPDVERLVEYNKARRVFLGLPLLP
ncbi:probable glutathione S-transferase GSTU6 [Sorghum bicolor]|uniref:glutathione transferase n=1 Tax=Sorghum bicolor TaxID=4558 RepID=C5Y7W3_SORBI|nr:probable glutathione S-transferase GSTU6 [Sorghum bicolor]EES08965.1 hypothetical protein SORBI_3005G212700 [Sorghum bicolor]|eukprot:XP_002449977.1 probable glutathione S-transferase GSTU6 [Sorghum bicolor]